MHAVGYGEMRPRVANTTAAAKAQNRRVEIVSEGMGGDSSLDMELAVWTREMVMAPLRFRSEINFAIDAAFRRYGIQIPFPQRDLHLRPAPPSVEPPPASPGAAGPRGAE